MDEAIGSWAIWSGYRRRRCAASSPIFLSRMGCPRVDDRRIISGIIFVIRNGLRWRDAPATYRPAKTIYNRFIRWSRLGAFNRILAALSAKGGQPDRLMIDATHLKAHLTAASLLKKGELLPVWWTHSLARVGHPLELHGAEIADGRVPSARVVEAFDIVEHI